jgi:hypothetical protein
MATYVVHTSKKRDTYHMLYGYQSEDSESEEEDKEIHRYSIFSRLQEYVPSK